jgi:predicted metalloprotease
MLRGGRESDNVEDARGIGGRGIALGGGGLGMLVIIVLAMFCGADPSQLLNQMPGDSQVSGPVESSPQEADQKRFVGEVLATTEDAWRTILPKQAGKQYRAPKLVVFRDRVNTACGLASSATGPFYCPGDEKLYLDMAFFDELKRDFKANGDFAQAYVIAHEVGHHVQNQMGTMSQVNSLQQRVSEGQSNQLSVRLELQADCYGGVWANFVKQQGKLEAGDPEEALKAAAAVGDDMIQKRTQGYVVPDSFTHGSARDRATWFAKGFQTGDMRQCNTFGR